jgi:penicillin-binding protein activator
MEDIMSKMILMVFAAMAIFLQGCGTKQFTKGEYDDVNQENLLNDSWSETDMQKAVQELVAGLTKYRGITEAKKPPRVMVTRLQNKTSEVIDTQNIMDMIRVELSQSGNVKFIDKEARQDVADEYEYQNSGMVNKSTKKGPGGQVGADYVINGRLDSIVQEVGKNKTVYYKLTLNLTNLTTTEIDWTGQKQIRKSFKKRRVGM